MAGTWTDEEQKTLIAMIQAGVSARRIAVRMKRPLHSIKVRAKDLGKPFPDERDLKRERKKILDPSRGAGPKEVSIFTQNIYSVPRTFAENVDALVYQV